MQLFLFFRGCFSCFCKDTVVVDCRFYLRVTSWTALYDFESTLTKIWNQTLSFACGTVHPFPFVSCVCWFLCLFLFLFEVTWRKVWQSVVYGNLESKLAATGREESKKMMSRPTVSAEPSQTRYKKGKGSGGLGSGYHLKFEVIPYNVALQILISILLHWIQHYNVGGSRCVCTCHFQSLRRDWCQAIR